MGKKKGGIFKKKKRSVFKNHHPFRQNIVTKNSQIKAIFHKQNPQKIIHRGVKRTVGPITTTSNRLRDKIAENTLVLNNPFSSQFYLDRCSVQ